MLWSHMTVCAPLPQGFRSLLGARISKLSSFAPLSSSTPPRSPNSKELYVLKAPRLRPSERDHAVGPPKSLRRCSSGSVSAITTALSVENDLLTVVTLCRHRFSLECRLYKHRVSVFCWRWPYAFVGLRLSAANPSSTRLWKPPRRAFSPRCSVRAERILL